MDISFARDPANRLFFTVSDFIHLPPSPIRVGANVPRNLTVQSNVWGHAANALTAAPEQQIPIATAPLPEHFARLDAIIQIVWPRDRDGGEVPVAQADAVNITAALFHRGTRVSLSPDTPLFQDYVEGATVPVRLYKALNHEPLRPAAIGQRRLAITPEGLTYPVWDFNEVDVAAAKDPNNKYFFQVKMWYTEGSNIWVHGADGRTIFPAPDVPTQGCP